MPNPNRPLLQPEQLLAGWTPRRIGRRVLTLPETDSTNNVALAAAGEPDSDGLAVFADFQSAGRGRQGRAWLAPRGASILCSVLLLLPAKSPRGAGGPRGDLDDTGPRPGEDWAGRLTLTAAVATCEAIRRATDVNPAIKWPNDLRVGRRKLAGMLIESRSIDAATQAWVMGIGINCYQQVGHFPEELRDAATSLDLLSAHPIDRSALARELLRVLDGMLTDDSPEAMENLYVQWLAHAEPLGQLVRLRSDGREYEGHTVAVDPKGGLVLQCADGRQRWFDPLLTSLL